MRKMSPYYRLTTSQETARRSHRWVMQCYPISTSNNREKEKIAEISTFLSLPNCQTQSRVRYWLFFCTKPKLNPSTGRTLRPWSHSYRGLRYQSLINWCERYKSPVKIFKSSFTKVSIYRCSTACSTCTRSRTCLCSATSSCSERLSYVSTMNIGVNLKLELLFLAYAYYLWSKPETSEWKSLCSKMILLPLEN